MPSWIHVHDLVQFMFKNRQFGVPFDFRLHHWQTVSWTRGHGPRRPALHWPSMWVSPVGQFYSTASVLSYHLPSIAVCFGAWIYNRSDSLKYGIYTGILIHSKGTHFHELNQLITYRSFHTFINDRCKRPWSKVIQFSGARCFGNGHDSRLLSRARHRMCV